MVVTRREFGQVVLAGVPAAAAVLGARQLHVQARTANRSLINGVQFGLQPFCYHDLPMIRENRGELIRRLVRNGMGMVELHATWVEPRFNGAGATASAARGKLREWRLNPPAGYYQGIPARALIPAQKYHPAREAILPARVRHADRLQARTSASTGPGTCGRPGLAPTS